ncbi:GrpB family protein [Rhizobium sp. BK060]|uniref:GrpB family protein n=1 Tax=Rhizobium sp. BK060 TaxID=2587096 RepID=UPI0017CFFAE3|nr:GrpB-like predicted nucleotidyltransferase (UPF0157 family) [Rhizobium sp. BK060]
MPTLVELVPYDPYWVRHFSVAEAALKTDLGPNVVAVDHIGSTAIPGMSAKPIIDIDITMSSLSVIPSARAPLVNAGYEPRGNRKNDEVLGIHVEFHPQASGVSLPSRKSNS